MGQETGIAWTNHTANFWWGCQRVSPGCEHCYAEQLATTRRKLKVWGPPSTTERLRMKGIWHDVPKWNTAAQRDGVRRRMFVSSMADVFEAHPQVEPWRAEALALLERCTALDVQLLTKRPENVRAMVPPSWLTSWPSHVWIGTTVEDQKRAEQRIPHLLRVPAAVRFLSCEPLLERVSLQAIGSDGQRGYDALSGIWRHDDGTPIEGAASLGSIAWVIVGGESGSHARPFDVAWARSIAMQCYEAGVACFVKQMGDAPVDSARVDIVNESGGVAYVRPAGDPDGMVAEARRIGRDVRPHRPRFDAHHGADPSEWPAELRVQEFPQVSP
jgi:protein gp37